MRAFIRRAPRAFSRRAPPGALVLPRRIADRGQVLWPKCARCMRAVDAYGIEAETDERIEIWVRCDGIRIDVQTGQAVPGAARQHESIKTSATILKGLSWTANRFAEIVSKMAFFAPDGEGTRQFVQTEEADTVRTR